MFGKAVQDALKTADEVVTTFAAVRAAALQLVVVVGWVVRGMSLALSTTRGEGREGALRLRVCYRGLCPAPYTALRAPAPVSLPARCLLLKGTREGKRKVVRVSVCVFAWAS